MQPGWVLPPAQPSPCTRLSGQSDGRSAQSTGEPSGPIALGSQSPGGPRVFPAVPLHSPESAKCPGRGGAQGRGAGARQLALQPSQSRSSSSSSAKSGAGGGRPFMLCKSNQRETRQLLTASQQQPHRAGSETSSSSKELIPRSLITKGFVIFILYFFVNPGLMFTG